MSVSTFQSTNSTDNEFAEAYDFKILNYLVLDEWEETNLEEESEPITSLSFLPHFLVSLLLACATWRAIAWSSRCGDDYVKETCNVTRYKDLCINSLSPFSNSATRDPRRWARAAVSVTVGEAKKVTQNLINQKQNRVLRGKQRMALLDCIECFHDSLDNLYKSLGELRSLKSSSTFDRQMENVETWVSAALTGEDTCLDGFIGGNKGREVKSLVCNGVLNVTYMTSNALALVVNLASAGEGDFTGP
ncbi:LOW QUALITY PROTEIN: pectinesterase inhibitor 6 [Telopea speciosissima]|uniref:LOW QUALITY PROTEIN: pectinesterase inhibitor 6 n=1 Tax=Telopea speciosissima TaxID=54955 RepID=UPI001CC3D0DC|nr:LOW QUALITY PROTEIN: pectinesterase inhibitor 6 [Telopea speciosissima]